MQIHGFTRERALSAGRAGALCTDAVRAASILYARSLFGTRDHVEREHAYDTAEYWTKVKSILHYFSVRGERRCITEIRARSLARSRDFCLHFNYADVSVSGYMRAVFLERASFFILSTVSASEVSFEFENFDRARGETFSGNSDKTRAARAVIGDKRHAT